MRLGWGGNRRVLEYICAGLLFSLIIGITVFGRPLESLDELWQYSFGSNIRKGCLPYQDINMVTAPFSQFVGAGALWVFGDCLLVYRGLGTVLGTLCMLLFCLFHWPCSTTCLTIKKETGSWKWTAVAVILPTMLGFLLCVLVNFIL